MPRRALAEQLQSCLEPLKPEVMHGVLAGLFAMLGAEFASKQLEDRLQALDLCILPASPISSGRRSAAEPRTIVSW